MLWASGMGPDSQGSEDTACFVGRSVSVGTCCVTFGWSCPSLIISLGLTDLFVDDDEMVSSCLPELLDQIEPML